MTWFSLHCIFHLSFSFEIYKSAWLVHQGKTEDGADTADEANPSNKHTSRSFINSFSKRKVGLFTPPLSMNTLNREQCLQQM